MSVLSESYMPQIESTLADLRVHESAWGKQRDKMNVYKIELDEVTRELKARHGYDAIEAEMSSERDTIGRLETELFRMRCSLIVGTVDLLYRANPSSWLDMLGQLSGRFHLDFSDPGIPGDDAYLDVFHRFALAVRAPGYWDADPPKLQENGYVWLYEGKVGLGIHRDLIFDNLRAFLSWSDGKLAELGGTWAKAWLSDAAMDREKRRALYEAMRAEFERPVPSESFPGWQDSADSYVCRGCGREVSNPNVLPGGPGRCPACGRDMSRP